MGFALDDAAFKQMSPDPAAQLRRQQIIAFSALLVLLVGGGALAWWKFYTPTPDEPLVDIGRDRFGGGGPQFRPNPPTPPRDGVRSTGANRWEVRTGEARMNISQNDKGWQYTFRYQPIKYRTPTDSTFFAAKYRSGLLELTKDQQTALNALPAYSSEMVVDEADRKKLIDQFQAYLGAPDAEKPKKETELTQTLADVGKRSLEPTLAAVDAHVAKIKSILTADQIAKLTQPRTAGGNRPTTTPTTGAATPPTAR